MFFSGLEKTSLVDFDGYLACTVFTQGCNFKCPFCQNSDLVIGQPQQKISEEYVLSFLERRKGLLDAVCVTGGEPTIHKEITAFIKKVKEFGYLVKLDTNGTNPDVVINLAQQGLIDYVAMDIKNSFDDYHVITGCNCDVESVKGTAKFLLQNKIDYEFRTTLVKDFHTEKSIEKIANDICGAEKYFLQKFEDKGGCIKDGLSAIDKETAESFKIILQKNIKRVNLRGY